LELFLLFDIFETGSHYVAQAGLKLEILPPQSPKLAGIIGMSHHGWLHPESFAARTNETEGRGEADGQEDEQGKELKYGSHSLTVQPGCLSG
jgi:hypothetical protein